MNDKALFQERLPKYVFMGSRLKRRSIQMAQWTDRLAAILILVVTGYLVSIPLSEHDFAPAMVGLIIAWIACATLIYSSELKRQPELDGSTPIAIFEDRITIPPRFHRKLTGKANFVLRSEIDHIEIRRGKGTQYVAYGGGVMDGIVWDNSPIELIVVLRTGKKHRSGYKPPSTMMEIIDTLAIYWNMRIDDSDAGMGKGTIYRNGQVLGEYSYIELKQMNLFEWQ